MLFSALAWLLLNLNVLDLRNSDYVVITLKVNGSRRMNYFAGQVNSDEK